MRAVGSAYFRLAEACRGVFALNQTVTDMQTTVSTLVQSGKFTVDNDWTVHAVSDDDKEEATNNTVSLQAIARHLGEEDDRLGPLIAGAVEDLGKLAPTSSLVHSSNPSPADTEKTAKTDLQAFEDGTASDEQIARLQVASQLTPDQIAAIKRGGQVDLPPEQVNYLRGLMRGQDGMWMEQIDGIGSKMPGDKGARVQAAMANAMELASNPQVQSDDGFRGGMPQLPDTMRKLLTENPAHNSLGGYWVDEKGFTAASNIVNRSDQSLRQGSDLDRGMLKQSSEIVKFADANSWDDGLKNVGNVADKMVSAAGPDHRAISDFINGHGMDATVTDGGKYNADDHVVSLLAHQWGKDQHGAENLFKWIGTDANSHDPVASRAAGETASDLGQLIARNENHLAQALPNHGADGLGKVNPGVTQALAGAMAPYLPNFVGITDPSIAVNTSARPFATEDDLSHLFKVLDSDPTAAVTINNAGSKWQNYMAYQVGLHPDNPALGEHAGLLSHAMSQGLNDQIQSLQKARDWQQLQKYNDQVAWSDSIAATMGAIPGVGTAAGPVGGVADAWFKDKLLDTPGDPSKPLDDPEWVKALKPMQTLAHPDSIVTMYELADGYIQNHPEAAADFGGLTQDGHLNWDVINNRPDEFRNDYGKHLSGEFDTYDKYYKDGQQDANITSDGNQRPNR